MCLFLIISSVLGSGCGSVGSAVAFDTLGPWIKSSHRHNFMHKICLLLTVEKIRINKKALTHPYKTIHFYWNTQLHQLRMAKR